MRVITFDICSVVVLIFLIASLYLRKTTKGTANKIFLFLCYDVLISNISDIIRFSMLYYLAPSKFSVFMAYAFQFLYYYTRNTSMPIYILYVFAAVGMWHDFRNNLKFKLIWGISVGVILVTLTLDLFIHKVFTIQVINNQLTYVRGPLLPILYVSAFWFVLYSVITIVKYRSYLSRKKFFVLIWLFPILIMGVVIQIFMPNMLLELFTTAFPLLLISVSVQKPEEIIDVETGILNMTACREEMENNFRAKRKFRIIFVQLIDYKKLKKLMDKDAFNKLLANIIKKIYGICGSDECDVYYLDWGTFAVVSLKDTDEEFKKIAEEICLFFNETNVFENSDLLLNVKICYANCPDDFDNVNAIMAFVQNISRTIQEQNQVIYIEEKSKIKNFQIMHQIDLIITEAIKNRSFSMYYQPIYNVETKKFSAAEALIRLNDEKYGFVSPGIFIPAAERSGAIHQIGDFIIDDVCRFISQNGLEKLGVDYIEINLSVAQCIERNLFEKIINCLEKYRIAPNKINLEITETAPEFNHEMLDRNIKELSAYGIPFSLDDFGTGFSNIKRITTLPLNLIKLDKFFVDEYTNPSMQVFVNNTISMIKKLDKKVLIEGCENEDAVNYFINHGCDYVQGYFYSRPLPESEYISFISKNNGVGHE
ncbi:MAG: EAL domain-containing protein [Treponema sp.]|nr:EAL domain-containing protein [Treponema sp.]